MFGAYKDKGPVHNGMPIYQGWQTHTHLASQFMQSLLAQ